MLRMYDLRVFACGSRWSAVAQSKSDPRRLGLGVILDQAALEAHGQIDYLRAANGNLPILVSGRPDSEYLDRIA